MVIYGVGICSDQPTPLLRPFRGPGFPAKRKNGVHVPDSTQTDSTFTDTSAIYFHVDVRIETDWGEPEMVKNVRATVLFTHKIPRQVQLKEENRALDTIELIEGMKIMVIHPKTGMVLKKIRFLAAPKK